MPTEPELKARISLDGSGWEAGIKQAQASVKSFAGTLGEIKGLIAGAFTITAITLQTQKIIEYGGKIHDLSTRFGISTDALQEFDYAAKLTGSSLDSFVTAFRKLSVAQVKAAEGDQDLIHSFRVLGVTFQDLMTKNPELLFKKIAEHVRTSGVNSTILKAVIDTMGKSADEILPAMRENFAAMAKELDAIGGKLGPDAIKRLDDYGDAWTRLGEKMKPVWALIADIGAQFASDVEIVTKTLALMGKAEVASMKGDKIGHNEAVLEAAALWRNRPKVSDPKPVPPGGVQLNELNPVQHPWIRTSEERPKQLVPNDINANEMQKIGAFVGGPDRLINLAELQYRTLMKIEKNTSRSASSSSVVFP